MDINIKKTGTTSEIAYISNNNTLIPQEDIIEPELKPENIIFENEKNDREKPPSIQPPNSFSPYQKNYKEVPNSYIPTSQEMFNETIESALPLLSNLFFALVILRSQSFSIFLTISWST